MRLSHLAAVATLVALLGAMFVAMGSASAAALGMCSTSGTSYLVNVGGAADTCTIPPANSADAVLAAHLSTDPVDASSIVTTSVVNNVITVTAVGAGSVMLTDDNGTDSNDGDDRKFSFVVLDGMDESTDDDPDENYVNNAGVGAVIEFSDTDGIVAAGTPVSVNVAMRYGGDAVDVVFRGGGLNFAFGGGTATFVDDALVPQVRLLQSPQPDTRDLGQVENGNAGDIPGASDDDFEASPSWTRSTNVDGVARSRAYTLSTAGASGEYTITATIGITRDGSPITVSRDLTVGDPGDAVTAVDLRYSTMGTATTTDDEDGRASKGGTVELEWVITNSLGAVTNDSSLNVIQISGTNGRYTVGTQATATSGLTVMDKKAKGTITVGSHQNKERVVTVTITAIGGASVATDSIDVHFTGNLDAVSIDNSNVGTMFYRDAGTEADGDSGDNRDSLSFKISGADASGNFVPLASPDITVTSKATGKTVTAITAMPAMSRGSKVYDLAVLDNDALVTSPLDTGEYTMTVTQGTKRASVDFTVVGMGDNLELDVSNTAPTTVGDNVQVTAMVSSDGMPVADGTKVTFKSRDTVGDSDSVLFLTTEETVTTKGGEAEATFVVIGPGSAVITAAADGDVRVEVVTSTAGAPEPEAMPEEEASVSCLSELSGFATWSCGVSADASEIFEMVSARGVSAIHLWNGSTWVRYSVVDDAMVPGSSDFMVTENDILYISN